MFSVDQSCMTPCNPSLQPSRLLCPWNHPGKNIGMDCHFLLQGIFLEIPGIEPTSPALAGRFFTGEQVIDGFRVQIYASNAQQKAKQEAFELHQRIETQIDVPVYTLSEPPFWKVRIGNFLNREEANTYKATLLELFPELTGSTYIVPDKIIIIR